MSASYMEPTPDSYSIHIPITFDYKGGRGENSRNKVIFTVIMIVITVIVILAIFTNVELEIWQRFLYAFIAFYVGLWLVRYIGFNELYFSDVYETLLERDFKIETPDIWQIFDIDSKYPYTCYYKNGTKGIFVRMEKEAVTGKPDTAMYDHYEAISDAYNLAHSMNMNIVHIDYMDNIGNDPRLQEMYNNLVNVKNPDMHDMLVDMYDHLSDEMSRNYASFDIYLYLSRDSVDNFLYNVQNVSNIMLGGNFITYKVMNRSEISIMCKALFNFHEFSIVDACNAMITEKKFSGIIPLTIRHGDGNVEILNHSQEELAQEERAKERRLQEQQEEYLKNRHSIRRQKREEKKRRRKGVTTESENLFNDSDNIDLF